MESARVRIGVDPKGGTDPKSSSVQWSRCICTYGEWDTISVGRADPVVSGHGRITIFLDYVHSGETVGQVSAFGEVRLVGCR